VAEDGPKIIRELVGPHQSLNLVREAIAALQAEIDNCPLAEDPLTSARYRTWDRRTMIKLGAAFGHLRHAQGCGHITPEVYTKLYLEIMGITARAAARVDMSGVIK